MMFAKAEARRRRGRSHIDTIVEAAAGMPDGQIIEALRLDYDRTDPAERMVRVALMTLLESRHDIADAMEAWSLDWESGVTQEEAMIAAVLA